MSSSWARVSIPESAVDDLPYQAYEGVPGSSQRRMPIPAVLVIDDRAAGTYLVGYAVNGKFAGDTWHRGVDEAMGQASFAYGQYLGPWQPIPDDVADPGRYALECLPD